MHLPKPISEMICHTNLDEIPEPTTAPVGLSKRILLQNAHKKILGEVLGTMTINPQGTKENVDRLPIPADKDFQHLVFWPTFARLQSADKTPTGGGETLHVGLAHKVFEVSRLKPHSSSLLRNPPNKKEPTFGWFRQSPEQSGKHENIRHTNAQAISSGRLDFPALQ
jgi:hypothetical protein